VINRAEIKPLRAVDSPVKAPEPLVLSKLDLGCGQNKKEGFTGVDLFKAEGVDVVHDLLAYPWPFEDASVDEIHCSHFLEHVGGLQRPRFMEEVYRVLKVGCSATFITPYWSSERSVQDFSHAWPPVAPPSYLYFNKKWREDNKLTHGLYDIKADFDIDFPGQQIDGLWANRHPEAQNWAARHYTNVILDLTVRLKKK
jgi:SAM-dependent methyltransferase